jgi:carbamoyl-phosphate synthase large subunit
VSRIQLGGAGGAPTNNVIRGLRESGRGDYLIGQTSVPSDLLLADVDERYVVPPATAPDYREKLLALLGRTQPDLLHLQHDFEVLAVSRLRSDIEALGTMLFLPAPETVEACVDKFRSYELWQAAGLPVPETRMIHTPEDLEAAMRDLGPQVWLRATTGGGGRGALPTDSPAFARAWLDHHDGWGTFSAARMLTPRSVTWLSIWFEGELVVAQGRRRHSWAFSDRAVAGVTGVTQVGETVSDPVVDEAALATIRAVDDQPHGIFGVDLTYDADGVPNPTEINIGRFFTTVHFFAAAGVNFPLIYRDLILDRRFPELERSVNPLPPGLAWVRGMDVPPVLTTVAELEKLVQV